MPRIRAVSLGASPHRRGRQIRLPSAHPSVQGDCVYLFTLILIGGVLGWAAGMVVETRNWRVILLNVVVGISGVMLAEWLLGGLIGVSAFNPVEFNLGGLLVSSLGATVLLAAVQLLDGVAGRRALPRLYPASAVFEYPRTWTSYESETSETNKTIRIGRALRPLITVGLAGMLLLIAGCATR
jgi:uncharacterized membrane protein YeaQ/YmgE (transglycosylase-associated protein family)